MIKIHGLFAFYFTIKIDERQNYSMNSVSLLLYGQGGIYRPVDLFVADQEKGKNLRGWGLRARTLSKKKLYKYLFLKKWHDLYLDLLSKFRSFHCQDQCDHIFLCLLFRDFL